MPTAGIMAARTQFNKGTENADNKVAKLEGRLPHVKTAKTVGNCRSLNYRLAQMLTHVLASNAITAIDEYSTMNLKARPIYKLWFAPIVEHSK